MKHFIVRFYKEIPQITGMTSIAWFDSYGIFSATAEAESRGKSCTQCLEESRLTVESNKTFLKLCSTRFPNVCPRKAA